MVPFYRDVHIYLCLLVRKLGNRFFRSRITDFLDFVFTFTGCWLVTLSLKFYQFSRNVLEVVKYKYRGFILTFNTPVPIII